MYSLPVAVMFLVASLTAAHAEVRTVQATFMGKGTYSTAEGCKKLAALLAGGDRNISTVPETLTANGFEGWEGSCTFTSFTEIQKGKRWKALMHCVDGPEEGPESDIFERLPDGKMKVTIMGGATVFERCDGEKGK
jgi:hypothetical protein